MSIEHEVLLKDIPYRSRIEVRPCIVGLINPWKEEPAIGKCERGGDGLKKKGEILTLAPPLDANITCVLISMLRSNGYYFPVIGVDECGFELTSHRTRMGLQRGQL